MIPPDARAFDPTAGELLHRGELKHEPFEIRQSSTLRWLKTASGGMQSAMVLADPSALVMPNHHSMLLGLAHAESPQRVLNLGFGGGGFERCLRSKLPSLELDSVEIEPLMVELAREYFEIPPTWPVSITHADDYLRASERRYDLILCDIFVGEALATCLAEPDFFRLIAQRLQRGGVVALNLAPKQDQELLELLQIVRAHFRVIRLAKVINHSNIVVLLANLELSPQLLQQRAASLEQILGAPLSARIAEFSQLPALPEHRQTSS